MGVGVLSRPEEQGAVERPARQADAVEPAERLDGGRPPGVCTQFGHSCPRATPARPQPGAFAACAVHHQVEPLPIERLAKLPQGQALTLSVPDSYDIYVSVPRNRSGPGQDRARTRLTRESAGRERLRGREMRGEELQPRGRLGSPERLLVAARVLAEV